tara:strand:+ start:2211 stop:3137 length:927 start_codon:yes stop_codon:yes gene_type:complete
MSVFMGALALGQGIFGAIAGGKARREAQIKENAANSRIAELESNRQDPINPYANARNPYANLQVATGAAEMQAEQVDISLANSLDTLRSTGASAGGATALARAAAQSKKGVSASIEQQEAKNDQLRAQGDVQLQQMQAAGKQFQYGATEKREMQELNRQGSLASSYNQQAAAYKGQQQAGIGQAIGGLASVGIATGGFGLGKASTPPVNTLDPKTASFKFGDDAGGASSNVFTGALQGTSNQLQGYFKDYNSNIQNSAQNYIKNAPNFNNLQNPLGGFGGLGGFGFGGLNNRTYPFGGFGLTNYNQEG